MMTYSVSTNSRHVKGFTLLEVLIALVVLALALTALTDSIYQSGKSQLYRKEKTMAHYVAMYRLGEMKIEQPWPNLGTTRGNVRMLQREWHWEQKVEKTSEGDFRIASISVALKGESADEDYKLAKVQAFLAKPADDSAERR